MIPAALDAAARGLHSLMEVEPFLVQISTDPGPDGKSPTLELVRERYNARVEATKKVHERERYAMRLTALALSVAEDQARGESK